jgi:hypothetical protein
VQLEGGEFRVTELPIRKWTQDYKEYLDSMVKPEDKNATPLLLDYKCAPGSPFARESRVGIAIGTIAISRMSIRLWTVPPA